MTRDKTYWTSWLIGVVNSAEYLGNHADDLMSALAERESKGRREAVEECYKLAYDAVTYYQQTEGDLPLLQLPNAIRALIQSPATEKCGHSSDFLVAVCLKCQSDTGDRNP